MRQVFLDHQSTTPILPQVFEAMRPFLFEEFGSPSSLHRLGLTARDALSRARSQIAGLIHAKSPDEIVFTSSGTESANLAIKGVAFATHRRGNHFVVSSIEHPAVLGSVAFLEKHGFSSTKVPVDSNGRIDPTDVRKAITDQTCLIAVHHVNHDIGAIEPVAEIGDLAAELGIPLFVDASASAGWLPINVETMGASLLSLSPHRFYGPKGVGVLYRNRRVSLGSLIHGGVQEAGRRAGMENMPGIVGAGAAAEIASREISARQMRVGLLQRQLWEGLRDGVPYVRLNGPELGPDRAPTNLNVSAEFIEGEAQALSLDMLGVAVSTGPSCVNKSMKISHVLAAIGLDPQLAQSNVIFSLGQENTAEEIEFTIEAYGKTVKKLRAMSPLWEDFQSGAIDSIIRPRGKTGKTLSA